MRGCLFGSDQTKYYVHGCNFHSFSGPFIHKKWGKIDVLYDRRQVSYFTMQKKCIFWVLCRNITFSCRNITMWPAFTPTFLCRAIFRGCAEIFIFRRHIHLWSSVVLSHVELTRPACEGKERLASHEAPHEQQFYNSFKPSMSFASPVMVV